MAARHSRFHGRIEGAKAQCAVAGCRAPGEFKAPLQPSSFDGPGSWRFLCLDHVREHNAKYNFFEGMSPEEITDAQSPYGGWDRSTRAFAAAGADPAPAWSDFADPLEAIAGRFGRVRPEAPSRFSGPERRAMWDAYERYNRLQIAADTLRRFRDLAEGNCPDGGSRIERCIMNCVCRLPR